MTRIDGQPELAEERRAAPPGRGRACAGRARPSARRGAGSAACGRVPSRGRPAAARRRRARSASPSPGRRSRAARAGRAGSPPAKDDVPLDGQVREQRVLLEARSRRRAPRAGGSIRRSLSNQTSPFAADRARALGRASPAIARRTVVLPAPDGPTSATVSAPTSSATSTSKLRTGTVRSSRAVPM